MISPVAGFSTGISPAGGLHAVASRVLLLDGGHRLPYSMVAMLRASR